MYSITAQWAAVNACLHKKMEVLGRWIHVLTVYSANCTFLFVLINDYVYRGLLGMSEDELAGLRGCGVI